VHFCEGNLTGPDIRCRLLQPAEEGGSRVERHLLVMLTIIAAMAIGSASAVFGQRQPRGRDLRLGQQ
jgi:hypothetical protein